MGASADPEAWESPRNTAPPVLGWVDPETGRAKELFDVEAAQPAEAEAPAPERRKTLDVDGVTIEVSF